jgi:methylated-DNA-[protein]-cysteine S-methyltransferase
MAMTLYDTIDTPLGELLLAGDGRTLGAVRMTGTPAAGWRRDPAAFRDAAGQLRAYFAGELRDFDLPLAPHGTPFQQRVWAALREIPYGTTISYAELNRSADAFARRSAVTGSSSGSPWARG